MTFIVLFFIDALVEFAFHVIKFIMLKSASHFIMQRYYIYLKSSITIFFYGLFLIHMMDSCRKLSSLIKCNIQGN